MCILSKSSANDWACDKTNGERNGDKCLYQRKFRRPGEDHIVAKHARAWSQHTRVIISQES